MKNKIIICVSLLVVLTISCVTEKRCYEKFPPRVEYVKKDSIVYKERIVRHDTTIYLSLPKDTILAHDTIIRDVNGDLYVRPLVMKGKYSVATAWIFNNVLNGRLEEGVGDALTITLKNAISERDYYKEQYEKESKKETKIIHKNTAFANYCIAFSIFTVCAIILALIFVRFRK